MLAVGSEPRLAAYPPSPRVISPLTASIFPIALVRRCGPHSHQRVRNCVARLAGAGLGLQNLSAGSDSPARLAGLGAGRSLPVINLTLNLVKKPRKALTFPHHDRAGRRHRRLSLC